MISELLELESYDDDRLLKKNINTFCLNSLIVYVSLLYISHISIVAFELKISCFCQMQKIKRFENQLLIIIIR